MKTNLLAQNDSLVIENLKANVGRSVENLSHSVTFPIDVDGAILPICCIETVPSDAFEISVECLLRQISSLKVPIMTNLRLNTAFYYCDNRLAWKKWDRFMTGGRSGNEVFDIPRVANHADSDGVNTKYYLLDKNGNYGSSLGTFGTNIDYYNSLHTYFGISMNLSYSSNPDPSDLPDVDDSELPLAFPFFDYQIICRDFYTNVDRLNQNPYTADLYNFSSLFNDWAYSNLFPSDDDEIRLRDGVNVISGFDAGDDPSNHEHGFLLDKVRYHDVRPDYFTTSKKAPMRGDAPTISTVNNDLKLPSGSTISLNNVNLKANLQKDVLTTSDEYVRTDDFVSYQWNNELGDSAYALSAHTITEGQKNSKPYVKQDTLQGNTTADVSITGTSSIDVTASDLRLLSQLTVWQELNMLHEPYYNDFLNAHFDNVRVGESPVEKPQYIGGTSQIISINEILQTSASSGTSYLGNQGATSMSLASNYVGKYYCNNYGYIIGVAYIVPDMLYKPAMPRGFSRRTKEDFYSPEFANLSMQATLNKEIFYSNDPDWNNSPWGYTGAFDELRSIPNRIAGDLLNPNYTDLQKWVLTREMANDNLPAMESIWLSLKGNVDKDAWNVKTMPAYMLQVANYIKAVRPMPKVAIPKAL